VFLPKNVLLERLLRVLKEDIGQGDITTALTIPPAKTVEAQVIAKESGIIAGVEEAQLFLESLGLKVEILVKDGAEISKGVIILKTTGDARTLLSVERTLLNFLSRMSGIATKTRRILAKVRRAGHNTLIASTRKTAPGLSYFDKKAVLLGGGDTHRLHLDDLILIKDNHLKIVGNLNQALEKVKKTVSFAKKIEIEVATKEAALEAARSGADIIMLDNFHPQHIRETIELLEKEELREKILIEASGGITEANILEFAGTGVDIISLGELTHTTKALDISLDVQEPKKR